MYIHQNIFKSKTESCVDLRSGFRWGFCSVSGSFRILRTPAAGVDLRWWNASLRFPVGCPWRRRMACDRRDTENWIERHLRSKTDTANGRRWAAYDDSLPRFPRSTQDSALALPALSWNPSSQLLSLCFRGPSSLRVLEFCLRLLRSRRFPCSSVQDRLSDEHKCFRCCLLPSFSSSCRTRTGTRAFGCCVGGARKTLQFNPISKIVSSSYFWREENYALQFRLLQIFGGKKVSKFLRKIFS